MTVGLNIRILFHVVNEGKIVVSVRLLSDSLFAFPFDPAGVLQGSMMQMSSRVCQKMFPEQFGI